MVEATVKTVQYVDPRIEPQPDPVYDYVIAPTQNQYYQIPASGLSNSSISFNNLTTLGVDRAYLDTFEIELTCEFTFNYPPHNETFFSDDQIQAWNRCNPPHNDEIVFDSFPFNKCCEEARININGGAFFSQPMSYLRAKERYMDQWKLSKCYENLCPCHKPVGQTEVPNVPFSDAAPEITRGAAYNNVYKNAKAYPTRLGMGIAGFMESDQGMEGGFNNSIIKITNFQHIAGRIDDAKQVTGECLKMTVTWREPVFCSPFSSRYDGTYGRPLYNITSMDLNFQLQNLGNMIRLAQLYQRPSFVNGAYTDVGLKKPGTTTDYASGDKTDDHLKDDVFAKCLAQKYITSYSVDIKAAKLCYQVMTIPPSLNKPLTTLVPYRRFVPYITDYYRSLDPTTAATNLLTTQQSGVEIQSGVYTLNEIPTAIWLFVAPSKAVLQGNEPDYSKYAYTTHTSEHNQKTDVFNYLRANWVTNKQFAFIEQVDLTLANTTQILNTAKQPDLYRIAKANGCQDSYLSWVGYDTLDQRFNMTGANHAFQTNDDWDAVLSTSRIQNAYGCGSVLRLIPGVDIIIPDQALIPGANANNMVFQAKVKCTIPDHSYNQNTYSLWLLFEYVGVAAISPGQCEITMNPLGSGEIMRESPVLSATSDATEGSLEGSGIWDTIKRGASIANHIADEGVLSRILKHVPGAAGASKWLASHGWGEPAAKRKKGACDGGMKGGAVIGGGLNEWV